MSSNLVHEFKGKTTAYRVWSKSTSNVSNRDKLEIFALHKQAISGDCEVTCPRNNITEKAKWNAWKNKQGLSRDEAMSYYISECNRQFQLYGGMSDDDDPVGTQQASTPPPSTSSTPEVSNGLASIPLLAAAASETQLSYMHRMSITTRNNGWWRRQRPVATSGSGGLEGAVIGVATWIESIALSGRSVGPISPSCLHAVVYPCHLLFLGIWIDSIFLVTIINAVVLLARTLVFGSRESGVTMEGVFFNEILRAGEVVRLLTERDVFLVKLVAFSMFPLSILCDLAGALKKGLGVVIASGCFTASVIFLWWYWLLVIPWCVLICTWFAVVLGVCGGIVELAS